MKKARVPSRLLKRNGSAENGAETEVPDHVKKLIELRKPKESISKDDAG